MERRESLTTHTLSKMQWVTRPFPRVYQSKTSFKKAIICCQFIDVLSGLLKCCLHSVSRAQLHLLPTPEWPKELAEEVACCPSQPADWHQHLLTSLPTPPYGFKLEDEITKTCRSFPGFSPPVTSLFHSQKFLWAYSRKVLPTIAVLGLIESVFCDVRVLTNHRTIYWTPNHRPTAVFFPSWKNVRSHKIGYYS